MGRPLKIAKAQAVLTLTNTTASTGAVTVSQVLADYGILPDMPFVVATTTGGLTAGTTYWVLQLTGASTFTVSATPLNANPTSTPVTLTNAGPVSVLTTVGAVDTGFDNPAGSANTYSVVGGNTSIYGNQIVVGAAIGRAGTGTLYNVSTSNAWVFGAGTDFANTISTGSAIQVAVANVNGSTDYVDVGFSSATHGFVTVAVANTSSTGNIIGTTGNAQTLTANQPVRFSANLGGLVANTTYFVKTISNTAAFTVSSTIGGADVALSTATGTPNALQDRIILNANSPINFTNAGYVYATAEAGYIVRQKGKQKYLVTGVTSGLTAPCYTANVANAALTPNTMNIQGTYANSATAYMQSVDDHTGAVFGAGNVLPNSSPVFATFNTAYAANTYGGQPYEIITINKS